MSNKCELCGSNTIFYVWTSSRSFPREKLFDKFNIKSKKVIKHHEITGSPVCLECYNKLNED